MSCRDEGHIDGLTAYHGGGDTDDETDGDWTAPGDGPRRPPAGDRTRLEDRAPLGDLAPGRRDVLYGWTTDNSWSAASVEFSADQIAFLRPGLVITQVAQGQRYVDSLVSEESFRRSACRSED